VRTVKNPKGGGTCAVSDRLRMHRLIGAKIHYKKFFNFVLIEGPKPATPERTSNPRLRHG
jgi:hypothetical protein